MFRVRAVLLICCFILTTFTIGIAQDAPPECSGTLPSRFYSAVYGQVLPGSANNLRAAPGVNAEKIGELPPYAVFEILDAPVCADGYLWWYVGYPNVNDTVGWTAEGDAAEYWIEPYIHPEPEVLLTPDDTEGQELVSVEYRGISFSVGRAIAAGVTVEHVFPNYIPQWMTSPATGSPTPYGLKFTFQDPEGMSSGFVLQVYALADFANLPDGVPSAIATLQTLLDPAAGAFVPPPPTGESLLLPDWTAPVLFQDAFRVIDFQNGRGVGYFAQYSYSVDPITSLIYTFTGLTSDGLYYVTLQKAVTSDLLPDIDMSSFDQDDWEAFYDGFGLYVEQITASLLTAEPDDFSPSLAPLDALIRSLEIVAPPLD
ncbi:MAG: SH3 domain-containing protein [Anaerolineae bacterium]|nr:SH3 domain-containing protein [Anaerolineae bacterium]